jgi:hypothetical protein
MDSETKGERARQILENEVYQEAQRNALQRAKDEWAGSTDPVAREQLWYRVQAINAVTRELEAIKGGGVKLRHDRDTQRKKKEARRA